LQLFVPVLEQDQSLSAQVREVAAMMGSSAERASAIARELLEWCRSPAQGHGPERALFALGPFLKGLADEHAAAARRQGLTLVSHCEEAEGWEADTDRVR